MWLPVTSSISFCKHKSAATTASSERSLFVTKPCSFDARNDEPNLYLNLPTQSAPSFLQRQVHTAQAFTSLGHICSGVYIFTCMKDPINIEGSMPTGGPNVASWSIAPYSQLARCSIRHDNKEWDGRSVVPARATFSIRSTQNPKHLIEEYMRQAPSSYIVRTTCDNGLFAGAGFDESTCADYLATVMTSHRS